MARAVRIARESSIHFALFTCALVSVATTFAIIWALVTESIPFFGRVPLREFLFGSTWAPAFDPPAFGVLPLLCGTFLVAGAALLLAVIVGVGAAIYLSEYAPRALREFVKPILEILAGIPSVVYGYFALVFITPNVIRPLFSDTGIFNAASAGIVVGFMILPTVASLCDDAFRAVPKTLREAAYALSATRFEVSTRVVFPGALSGVTAAILLALARAIGETMAVTLAAGMMPNLTLNPLDAVQTMTAFIVQMSLGDTPEGSIAYYTLFAVGLTLFAITLAINLAAQRVLSRFRETYE